MNDLLLDTDGKLRVEGGDFVVGDSTAQEIRLLIKSIPGSWKRSPTVGAALDTHLGGPTSQVELLKLKRRIRQTLEGDGLTDIEVAIAADGEISVSANRL